LIHIHLTYLLFKLNILFNKILNQLNTVNFPVGIAWQKKQLWLMWKILEYPDRIEWLQDLWLQIKIHNTLKYLTHYILIFLPKFLAPTYLKASNMETNPLATKSKCCPLLLFKLISLRFFPSFCRLHES